MKLFRTQSLVLLVITGVMIFFAGCKKDDPDIIFPPDGDPSIILVSPTQSHTLARMGESVSITFRMDDNEQLNSFKVSETWTSVQGQAYIRINSPVMPDKVISGTNRLETITYTVPTTQIQNYSVITLTASAVDSRGKSVSTQFRISVIPAPGTGGGASVQVQSYLSGDTIWSILNGTGGNYFSILQRANDPANQFYRDLGEISVNPIFSGELNAPNQAGADSIFVVTDPSRFNFEDLTWETTWEHFVTSAAITDRTGPLVTGDIVILKMGYPSVLPMFAVIKIRKKNDAIGALIIEYKYTFE